MKDNMFNVIANDLYCCYRERHFLVWL